MDWEEEGWETMAVETGADSAEGTGTELRNRGSHNHNRTSRIANWDHRRCKYRRSAHQTTVLRIRKMLLLNRILCMC